MSAADSNSTVSHNAAGHNAASANTEQPKAKLGQLRKLSELLRPYRKQIAIALVALVIAASSFLVLGQGLKAVIDKGLATSAPDALNQAMAFFLVVVLVLAMATYVRFYFVSWLGERVIADLRRQVFEHLLTLSPQFYENTRTGEALSRLTNDTTMLETVIGSSLSMALRNALMLVGGLIMLFFTSVKLTAFVLLAVPLVVVPIIVFGRRVRGLARDSQARLGDASAFLDEALHEVRTVQASVAEPVMKSRFAAHLDAVLGTAKARIRARAALIAIVIVLAFGAIGFILWTGGHDVIAGRITAGQLSAFVFYAVIVASAVGTISEVFGDLQRAAGATERLMELLSTRPLITAPAEPQALPTPVRGELCFEQVHFHYPTRPDSAALNDFSLTVKAGERVALVGPSGAGKSTAFQLLLRFYDPENGVIRLDGQDIRQLDPQALRSHLALVPQDPVIFADSVRENVRFARPEASDAEVRSALEAAYALDFVEQMPGGLDAQLGERGVRLSGGQRQRLAIARALLADRPVLLLDEATSALDAESERMVQLALDRLMQNRTTLIIAHRLATVRHADRIAVLDKGKLVALGSHDELVRDNPLYAKLARLQFLHESAELEAG
ncbi:ATP-binding cassette domain-containing protein [Permianibacter sp. IMCC34836]|uniref:ABC transporter transmembrane domain-containing protein n=1 Tax=Permianibacter fluminis TaxID=2738515 RepID=UPI0015541E3F|nr:ABC transporter transmembrane domain-containing protein [Permianibacter fluminis]NQD39102.1 ATP-binding cassette domain-containing protein [Permianibacter fluminis]